MFKKLLIRLRLLFHSLAKPVKNARFCLAHFIIKLIEIYRFFSALTPKVCRFEPTCSKYTADAIEKYGVIKGSRLGIKRICRCHPWYKGDMYDPVP